MRRQDRSLPQENAAAEAGAFAVQRRKDPSCMVRKPIENGCPLEHCSLSELRILLFLERCKTAFAQINSRQFVAFPQAAILLAASRPKSAAGKWKTGRKRRRSYGRSCCSPEKAACVRRRRRFVFAGGGPLCACTRKGRRRQPPWAKKPARREPGRVRLLMK